MHPENLTLFDDPEIADIIDHINEDHGDDMKHMALGLLNLTKVQQKNLKKCDLTPNLSTRLTVGFAIYAKRAALRQSAFGI